MLPAVLLLALLLASHVETSTPAPGRAPRWAVPAPAPLQQARRVLPPTRLGLKILSRCPVVVVARTISVRDAGLGAALLHMRVLERMLGPDIEAGDDLPVFSAAQQFQFGNEDLLFMKPYREAGRYEVVERVSSRDPYYAAKLAVARRTIWLLEIRGEDECIDATLELLLGMLQARDEWTRQHALEELRWMVSEQRDIFTEQRAARLRAAGRASARKDIAAGVEYVSSLLRSGAGRASGTPDKEQSRP